MGLFNKLFGGGGGGSGKQELQRVDALVAQCDDPDPKKRASACAELGRLGGQAKAATDKLLELMNDTDGDVCNAAADAYSKVERGL